MFSLATYAALKPTLPPTVQLIAVTKNQAIADIIAAYQAGIRDFGESRVQEALPKMAALAHYPDIRWHFIGHLQSNKARKVMEHFQWIHSLDTLALAQRLDRLLADHPHPPQILLQVKLRPDPTKSGWTSEQLLHDLPILQTLTHLPLRGLMTLLPQGLSPTEQQATFQETYHLAQQLTPELFPDRPVLSMGMSQDFTHAITAGTTFIRLGTFLFGDRPNPPQS